MTSTLQLDAIIKGQRRDALSRHPTLTGLDHIEVRREVRRQSSEKAARWDLLLCFVPAAPEGGGKSAVPPGITANNIVIRRMGDAPDPRLRVLDITYPQGQGNVLTIGLAAVSEDGGSWGEAADFPVHTLELVQLPTVDRYFRSASFALDVEAPSDMPGGAPAGAAEPGLDPLTPIDYLAKDYESFRQMLLDRLAVGVPQWQERNPVDLGMALVELLAYAGDYLSYYQDAVATEAYLGTARQRISVARHARLLDYRLHQGCNARVWVQMEVSADLVLPAGTPLLTSLGGLPPRIPTRLYQQALQQRPRVFETMHQARLLTEHNRLAFHTWGSSQYTLPQGATQATLRGHFPDLKAGQVLVFQEVISPATGRTGDADVSHRHALRLAADPTLSTDPLQDDAPVTEIQWHSADALPFDLPVAANPGGRPLRDISVALGNVVLADHGQTVEPEALPAAPREGRYRPRLDGKDITHRTALPVREARETSAAASLVQTPQEALPDIWLEERPRGAAGPTDIRRWTPRVDLIRAGRFAQEFKVEVDDESVAHLLLGDGVYGRKPAAGAGFTAHYRVGNGPAGNVGRETIRHVVSNDDGIAAVVNPLPTQGGVEPEPAEEAKVHAPHAFYVQERGVTTQDYVDIARRHPEVRQAAAVVRWTGSWHTVFILVHRRGGRPVDQDFIAEFREYMDRYRMSGYDLEVCPPQYAPLDIALTVFAQPGYFRTSVRQALVEAFSNSMLPQGQRGFFHPDNLSFGQPVYQSLVVARAAEIAGVMRVDVDRFARWEGRPAGQSRLVEQEIPLDPFEVARLDNDPGAPWRGVIRFNVVGGW